MSRPLTTKEATALAKMWDKHNEAVAEPTPPIGGIEGALKIIAEEIGCPSWVAETCDAPRCWCRVAAEKVHRLVSEGRPWAPA